jgi:hypothetical protein
VAVKSSLHMQGGRPTHLPRALFRRLLGDPERSCLKFLRGTVDAGKVTVELDEQERRDIGRRLAQPWLGLSRRWVARGRGRTYWSAR